MWGPKIHIMNMGDESKVEDEAEAWGGWIGFVCRETNWKPPTVFKPHDSVQSISIVNFGQTLSKSHAKNNPIFDPLNNYNKRLRNNKNHSEKSCVCWVLATETLNLISQSIPNIICVISFHMLLSEWQVMQRNLIWQYFNWMIQKWTHLSNTNVKSRGESNTFKFCKFWRGYVLGRKESVK